MLLYSTVMHRSYAVPDFSSHPHGVKSFISNFSTITEDDYMITIVLQIMTIFVIAKSSVFLSF